MAVKDKVVAITGAARGMGRAYTQGFLNEGAKVVAMDLSWEPSGFSGDKDDAFYKDMKARGTYYVATLMAFSGHRLISSSGRKLRPSALIPARNALWFNSCLRQRLSRPSSCSRRKAVCSA